MPQAYWIAHVEVTNPESYRLYAMGAKEAIAKYSGRFLVRGGRYVQLEGRDRPRNVVAVFPSFDAAVDCYHSPEYQAALEYAKGAAERDLVIVEADE